MVSDVNDDGLVFDWSRDTNLAYGLAENRNYQEKRSTRCNLIGRVLEPTLIERSQFGKKGKIKNY